MATWIGGTGEAVGVGVTVGLDAAVAVGVGVSVGAIYGVAVGAVAGVDESAAGAAGLVQASTAAAAATRATITPAMATDIGFSLDAILGCLCRGFMTGKCYTTREQGDRGHYAMAAASMRAGDLVNADKKAG